MTILSTDHLHHALRCRTWYDAVRVALGLYLAIHFVELLPWAAELFSHQGVLPVAAHSPLIFGLPNVLAWLDAPWMASLLVASTIPAAMLLAAGRATRPAALFLCYVWACLLGRNPLILNPGIPYVGWLLLSYGLFPQRPEHPTTRRTLYGLGWIVMAVGYTYSGAFKLMSPSWLDGSAIEWVLQSPLARPTWLRELLLEHPALLAVLSWGTLGLELLAAPLALSRRLRPWLWCALVGLHLGILCTVDFADLTAGMLLIHAATFDPRWLRREHLV